MRSVLIATFLMGLFLRQILFGNLLNHFRTPIDVGLEIMDNLRGHISGLAVPQFVIDAPGGGGKIPLLPEYVLARDKEKIVLRNFRNEVYEYPDVQEEHIVLKRGRNIEKRPKKKTAKKKAPLQVA